jgi:hypothetical protein
MELTQEQIDNIHALEAPFKILRETIAKHVPGATPYDEKTGEGGDWGHEEITRDLEHLQKRSVRTILGF